MKNSMKQNTPHCLWSFAITTLLCFAATGCRSVSEKQTFTGVPVIDTHIHLYDTTRDEGLPWPPESDTVLYRPILTKDFNQVAEANGITATVIVEASEWVGDNQWVLDLVKDEPGVYIGLVGSLPIGTPEFADHLKRFSADSRYVGIRMRERPGGEKFFNEDVWRDLKTLDAMNKTLDVLMFQFSLNDVDRVAKRNPDLRILINHVAGANIDGKAVDPTWLADLKNVAKNPNVYCKVSGLFQQSHQSPAPKDT
ncbi:MAG: amidohydrolase family protein, partial [Verrucomicrobia bacterium]|nr:amidohydrolase family protein [Verrucomicrobiota bacterium]